MDIQVTAKTIKALVKKLGKDSHLVGVSNWRYVNALPDQQIELRLDELDADHLEVLKTIMGENSEPSVRKVSQLINALNDPENKRVPDLKSFPKMLAAYLGRAGNPWLYSLRAGEKAVAYLPIRAVHREPDRRDADPYIEFRLCFNTKLQYATHGLVLHYHDIQGRTIPEILRAKNLLVPDEEMTDEYDKQLVRAHKYGGMQGEQFHVRRKATVADEDSRGRWWLNHETVDLSVLGKPSKAVMDMELSEEDTTRSHIESELYGKRCPVPEHPVLRLWSLLHHKNVWVQAHNVREYGYEQGLGDRLVLPATHKKLIGALVKNLDVLQQEAEAEDRSRTIRAKARSSIILAKGPAGTGKTLTAEVYAEEIQRPLYEVQSGQIGVEPREIEQNLQEILARATRLKMPLLINEADVFVQKRGADAKQNAIVSVFLRLMEYHNGLVFLTTNRAQDIDDAFISRCVAVISYTIPAEEERRLLWSVLLREFNQKLSDKQLDKVVRLFPKIVGRDIQNLIRLTARVCEAEKQEFTVAALRECSVFRDIHTDPEEDKSRPQ